MKSIQKRKDIMGEKTREKERKGEKKKMVNVLEALEIEKILEYSGFNYSEQRTIITADGFKSYYYILTLGDSDIVNLAKGFSGMNVSAGKISFGLRRNNLLKVNIHWDQ